MLEKSMRELLRLGVGWLAMASCLPVVAARAAELPAAGQTTATAPAQAAGADQPQAKLADDAQPAASSTDEIDRLIEQLGDPSYIRRQSAKEQLEKTGLLAFDRLGQATSSPNLEVATNAQYLLQSMRVVWALPTDSFEVQRLLKDYNEFQPSQKLDRMQRLARLHRPDGDLALLRFVRYESNENLSKIAALHLMDAAIDPKRPLPSASAWSDLIRGGLGDSQRMAAVWLRQTLRVVDEHSTDLEPWQRFVLAERQLLESNSDKTSEQTVKRLTRWTSQWLAGQGRRDEAVAFVQPIFDLLGRNPANVLDDVIWMLEADLPEAVLKFAKQRPELFQRSQLRYLLAESYLASGDSAAAERVADEARKLLHAARPPLRADGRLDHEAIQRMNVADFLNQRGMVDWAEAELRQAEALHTEPGNLSNQTELNVRDQLAAFYWTADQPQRAADVWRPILERAGLPLDAKAILAGDPEPSDAADRELLGIMTDRSTDTGQSFLEYVPSSYHFYLGLAAIKESDLARARTELQAAVAFATRRPEPMISINPDIVIAMAKAVGDDAEFQALTERTITRLEQYLRNELVKYESELTGASTRQVRLEAQRLVASECNQLAWLLANTGRKLDDAVELSERSLLLAGDTPTITAIYLDTLARCNFAIGNLDKAIQLQSQALVRMPHERQMQRQLAEFKAAKQKREASGTKDRP